MHTHIAPQHACRRMSRPSSVRRCTAHMAHGYHEAPRRPAAGICCAAAQDAHTAGAENQHIDVAARCRGVLLAAACGDVLGHPAEGLLAAAIKERYPDGLTDFLPAERWDLAGLMSGDMLMMVGLADSIVQLGKVDGRHAAGLWAALYNPARGYREFDSRVLEALREGEDPGLAGKKYLLGGFSLTGAVRIAPVALAYRNQSAAAVREAVTEALLSTHTHPIGIEGAYLQAMAIRWLLDHDASAADSHPTQLLGYLSEICENRDILKRLKLLKQWSRKGTCGTGRSGSWPEYLQGEEFMAGWRVSRMVSDELQWSAGHAVCTALWALALQWQHPEDAVITACHLGGYTHSTAAMTGALAGALHGDAWIPARWYEQLEDGSEAGRRKLAELGEQLYHLQAMSPLPADSATTGVM